jgi:hypothetical protein
MTDSGWRPFPKLSGSERLRWHRDIVRRRGRAGRARAGPGARQRTERSGRWCYDLPGRTSRGVTAASTASWQGSASPWRRPRSGRSSRTPASIPRPAGRDLAGPSSCGPRRRGSWRWTSSPPTCSVPGPTARSRRGRDSRISPGGIGFRHPQDQRALGDRRLGHRLLLPLPEYERRKVVHRALERHPLHPGPRPQPHGL